MTESSSHALTWYTTSSVTGNCTSVTVTRRMRPSVPVAGLPPRELGSETGIVISCLFENCAIRFLCTQVVNKFLSRDISLQTYRVPRRIGCAWQVANIIAASSIVENSTNACCFRDKNRTRFTKPNWQERERRSISVHSSGKLRMCKTLEGIESVIFARVAWQRRCRWSKIPAGRDCFVGRRGP
jgi:hypothetical protein